MAPKTSILTELYNQGLSAYKTCYPNKSVNDAQKQFSEKRRGVLKGIPKFQKVEIARDFVREWKSEKSRCKAGNIMNLFKVNFFSFLDYLIFDKKIHF